MKVQICLRKEGE